MAAELGAAQQIRTPNAATASKTHAYNAAERRECAPCGVEASVDRSVLSVLLCQRQPSRSVSDNVGDESPSQRRQRLAPSLVAH